MVTSTSRASVALTVAVTLLSVTRGSHRPIALVTRSWMFRLRGGGINWYREADLQEGQPPEDDVQQQQEDEQHDERAEEDDLQRERADHAQLDAVSRQALILEDVGGDPVDH